LEGSSYRYKGEDMKEEIEDREDGGEKEKKKVLLGSLNVDFQLFDEKDLQGNFLYDSPDVISVRKKSVYLPGWTGKEIKAVDEQLTIYEDVPIVCKDTCPFLTECPLVKLSMVQRWRGKSCHPPGERVLTNSGYKNIEDLKDHADLIVSLDTVSHHISRSYHTFKLSTRSYKDEIVTISSNGGSYSCTYDHIVLARFSKSILEKYCVYLMKKGNQYRVGQTKLAQAGSSIMGFGLGNRCNAEGADAGWILGIYNTLSEALLAEERYSIIGGFPRALFVATPERSSRNNKNSWVSQECLDRHHQGLVKPACQVAAFLKAAHRDIEFPMWVSGKFDTETNIFGTKTLLKVRACNFLPEIMDVPTLPEEHSKLPYHAKPNYTKASVEYSKYSGVVYNIETEKYHTYFVDGIATHNCPIMAIEAFRHFAGYVNDLEILPSDYTDIQLLNDLIRLSMQMQLCDKLLRKESPVETMVVGTDAKTSLKHETRQPNQYLALQRMFRQDISKLYTALIASRRDKIDVKSKVERIQDPSKMWSDLLKEHDKKKARRGEEDKLSSLQEELEEMAPAGLEE
jgi:hypothetical protein